MAKGIKPWVSVGGDYAVWLQEIDGDSADLVASEATGDKVDDEDEDAFEMK